MGLMLHCGGCEVSRRELGDIRTPGRTDTWVPIPHDILLKTVERSLDRVGLAIKEEHHGISNGGNRYFGLLEITDSRAKPNGDGGSGLIVGLRNSHDKMFPASLSCGSHVFVCDNLSFSGEVTLARKHTSQIRKDLPRLVETAMGRLGELRLTQSQRFIRYRTAVLAEREINNILIESLDAKIISSDKIGKVLDYLRSEDCASLFGDPSLEVSTDGKHQGYTAWRLHNAYTEILKPTNVFDLPRRTIALNGLIDSVVGLTLSV